MTKKKRSLRNEKLKANRASKSEEQRKERLRIEDKTRKLENIKPRETAPGTLKRLKRGEVEEKPKTGEGGRSKQLRLAVETEEERRTSLDAFLKSWQLCLSFKLDVLTT